MNSPNRYWFGVCVPIHAVCLAFYLSFHLKSTMIEIHFFLWVKCVTVKMCSSTNERNEWNELRGKTINDRWQWPLAIDRNVTKSEATKNAFHRFARMEPSSPPGIRISTALHYHSLPAFVRRCFWFCVFANDKFALSNRFRWVEEAILENVKLTDDLGMNGHEQEDLVYRISIVLFAFQFDCIRETDRFLCNLPWDHRTHLPEKKKTKKKKSNL